MSRAVVIKAKPKWQLVNLRELFSFRELFYVFSWRDLKVRYKQTVLGAIWAILQPLFQTFIFTLFFGKIAMIPSGNLPYSLFVLIGLVFWGFFSNALTQSTNSLIENEGILKKVYFPRLILPLSKVVTTFVDFLISFILLIVVSFYLGYHPNPLVFFIVPIGVIITAVGASGAGLLLSAFNVKYRDVRHVLPFFIQMIIFLTPVIYPTTIMRPSFRSLMALNPMTGIIDATRVVFSGGTNVSWNILGISALSSLVIFFVGLYYFRSTERFFADIA